MVYAGQESADFEELDWAALLNEMFQLMRLSVSKSATFKVDLSGKLPPIKANVTQIWQVMMNLLPTPRRPLAARKA